LHGGEGSVAQKRESTPATADDVAGAAGSGPTPACEASTTSDAASVASADARAATADSALASFAQDAPVAAASCQNCDTPLNGEYCSACGQRHEPHIHSLREFISEATESITHADSRVWRTLWALMVKPGFLTKEFLAGRRARYMPPFRLYLVLSVVFFLIAAATGHDTVRVVDLNTADGKSSFDVKKLEDLPAKPSESPEQRANRICTDFKFEVGSNTSLVDAPRLCRKVVGDNGHALVAALNHNIPRALIIFLPLLALTMRLMYWRRHYVEHLLFFVHTHAFAFVFLTAYVLVMRFVPSKSVQDTATVVMLLGLPYYTYRAMLRVYEQRKWATRVKFSVLTLSYFVLGVIMTVLLGLYTAVTL
jgi:hypothetical protein